MFPGCRNDFKGIFRFNILRFQHLKIVSKQLRRKFRLVHTINRIAKWWNIWSRLSRNYIDDPPGAIMPGKRWSSHLKTIAGISKFASGISILLNINVLNCDCIHLHNSSKCQASFHRMKFTLYMQSIVKAALIRVPVDNVCINLPVRLTNSLEITDTKIKYNSQKEV